MFDTVFYSDYEGEDVGSKSVLSWSQTAASVGSQTDFIGSQTAARRQSDGLALAVRRQQVCSQTAASRQSDGLALADGSK